MFSLLYYFWTVATPGKKAIGCTHGHSSTSLKCTVLVYSKNCDPLYLGYGSVQYAWMSLWIMVIIDCAQVNLYSEYDCFSCFCLVFSKHFTPIFSQASKGPQMSIQIPDFVAEDVCGIAGCGWWCVIFQIENEVLLSIFEMSGIDIVTLNIAARVTPTPLTLYIHTRLKHFRKKPLNKHWQLRNPKRKLYTIERAHWIHYRLFPIRNAPLCCFIATFLPTMYI